MATTEIRKITPEITAKIHQYELELKEHLIEDSTLRNNFIWHDIKNALGTVNYIGVSDNKLYRSYTHSESEWETSPDNLTATVRVLRNLSKIAKAAKSAILNYVREDEESPLAYLDSSDFSKYLAQVKLTPVLLRSTLFLNHPNEAFFRHLMETKTDLRKIMMAAGIASENLIVKDDALLKMNGAQTVIIFNLLHNAEKERYKYSHTDAGKTTPVGVFVSVDMNGISVINPACNLFTPVLNPERIFPVPVDSDGIQHCGLAISQIYARTIGSTLGITSQTKNGFNQITTRIGKPSE